MHFRRNDLSERSYRSPEEKQFLFASMESLLSGLSDNEMPLEFCVDLLSNCLLTVLISYKIPPEEICEILESMKTSVLKNADFIDERIRAHEDN